MKFREGICLLYPNMPLQERINVPVPRKKMLFNLPEKIKCICRVKNERIEFTQIQNVTEEDHVPAPTFEFDDIGANVFSAASIPRLV